MRLFRCPNCPTSTAPCSAIRTTSRRWSTWSSSSRRMSPWNPRLRLCSLISASKFYFDYGNFHLFLQPACFPGHFVFSFNNVLLNSIIPRNFRAQKAVNKWEQRYNEVTGLKKFDPRMSFQPTPRNKENFQTPVVNVKESRKSTGSPLARVNK